MFGFERRGFSGLIFIRHKDGEMTAGTLLGPFFLFLKGKKGKNKNGTDSYGRGNLYRF